MNNGSDEHVSGSCSASDSDSVVEVVFVSLVANKVVNDSTANRTAQKRSIATQADGQVVEGGVKKKKRLQCPVCKLDFIDRVDETTIVSTNKCNHVFCEPCLRESMKHRKACPVCRKSLSKNPFHPIFFSDCQ